MPTAMPRPRPGGSGSPQPMSSAAFSRLRAHSPSAAAADSPRTKSSPFATRLRRRISSPSRPSARAPASSWFSVAQATCGLPKPRNAVLGVVLVMTARASMRTAGMRYGPAAT
jgi:hypothetical protein